MYLHYTLSHFIFGWGAMVTSFTTLWHLLSGISNSSRLSWYPTQENTIPTDQRQWGSPVHEQLCEPSSARSVSGKWHDTWNFWCSDLCTVFCQTRHVCMAGVHLWSTGCPQQSIPCQNQVCIDVQTLLCMLWYYKRLPVHVCVHIIITRTTST